MLGLVPVGSAPIGILSLNIRNVANRDLEVDGWNPSVGTVIADTLDEDTADNSDYAYSSNLDDRQTPLVMALNNPLEAGTYTFNFTAQKDVEWSQVKLTLLDSNLTSVGASSWTGLVDRTFNTYSVTATTTATSAFIKVEARSDTALILDFTDPDKIDNEFLYHPNVPPNQPATTGFIWSQLNKYGFLQPGVTNLYGSVSETFTTSTLTLINAIVFNNNSYSPNNTLTAGKIVETTATGTHSATTVNTTIKNNYVYTYSVYLKSAGRTFVKLRATSGVEHSAVFTLTGTGSASTSTNLLKRTIESLSGGWYRCSITWKSTAAGSTNLQVELRTSTSTNSYSGDGVSGVFIWGLQCENSWWASTYRSGGVTTRYKVEYDPLSYKYVTNELATANNVFAAAGPSAYTIAGGSAQIVVEGTELKVTKTGSGGYTTVVPTTLPTVQVGKLYLYGSTQRLGTVPGNSQIMRIQGSNGVTVGGFNSTSQSSTSVALQIADSTNGTGVEFYGGATAANQYYYLSNYTIREVELQSKGMKVEAYGKNELIWSTDLTNTAWTALEATVSLSTKMSPQGNYDAFVIDANTNTTIHSISQNINVTSGSAYLFSVYCAGNGNLGLRIDPGFGGFWANFSGYGTNTSVGNKDASSTAGVQYCGNGWYRMYIRFVATATGSCNFAIRYAQSQDVRDTPFGNIDIIIWGPQVEYINAGPTPRSYMPTTFGTQDNGNDLYQLSADPSWYTGQPFTVYIEFGPLDNTTADIINFVQPGNTDRMRIRGLYGGYLWVNETYGSSNLINFNGINYLAVRMEPGNYATALNGVLTTSTATTPLLNNISYMTIGFNSFGSSHLYGYFRKFKYYPRALSDGELLNLTAVDPDQNAGVNLLTASW